MDQENIFKTIQKSVINTPLILVGSGASVPHGLVTRIRSGVPLVSITQEVSDSAAHLLANNARNYITIQQGSEPNKTEVCINRSIEVLDGEFRTINGFMSIIN